MASMKNNKDWTIISFSLFKIEKWIRDVINNSYSNRAKKIDKGMKSKTFQLYYMDLKWLDNRAKSYEKSRSLTIRNCILNYLYDLKIPTVFGNFSELARSSITWAWNKEAKRKQEDLRNEKEISKLKNRLIFQNEKKLLNENWEIISFSVYRMEKRRRERINKSYRQGAKKIEEKMNIKTFQCFSRDLEWLHKKEKEDDVSRSDIILSCILNYLHNLKVPTRFGNFSELARSSITWAWNKEFKRKQEGIEKEKEISKLEKYLIPQNEYLKQKEKT